MGKEMEYTLAIIDEGLLNITGFQTPDPYTYFNGKFPLLVRTWDIYQSLIGISRVNLQVSFLLVVTMHTTRMQYRK